MQLSRTSVGLAVRTAREVARLTLNDLAAQAGMTTSSLSRSERGERDLSFTEMLAISEAVQVDIENLRMFAETFERADAAKTQGRMTALGKDLNDLQRLAIEAAIEARAQTA